MSATAVYEDKAHQPSMQPQGTTSLLGPDSDPDDFPWPVLIRARLADHLRISQLVQARVSSIVSALTIESIARAGGAGGDGLLKTSQAVLSEAGDWICGNDLIWQLRFRRKFRFLPRVPGWLPDPPKPGAELETRPELRVISELAALRATLGPRSPLAAGIDRFLDDVSNRIEGAMRG